MLEPQIEAELNHPEVQSLAQRFADTYPTVLPVTGQVLLQAAQHVHHVIKAIVYDFGLPNLKPPKPAPLSDVYIIRALVMLRVMYRYELENGMNHAPSQDEFCTPGDYGGLLTATYEQLGLAAAGYLPDNACKGAPHVQLAAHILSEAGLMIERGSQTNKGRRGAPYQITAVGRMYAFYLFGDPGHVKSGRVTGWTGVPPVTTRQGMSYCPWISILGLDGSY